MIRRRFAAIVLFGIATRLIVLGVGTLMPSAPGDRDSCAAQISSLRFSSEPSHGLSEPGHWVLRWYHFDALHYLRIACRGYERDRQTSAGFVPLLPTTIRLCSLVGLDALYAGVLLPNVAFALGLGIFGEVVWAVSQRAATVWRACALLAAFPTSFFYSMPYSESVGFLFVSGAILAWIRYRPARACANLIPACLARQTAVTFGVATLVEWGSDWLHGRRPRHSAWIVFLAGAMSTLALWAFLAFRYDDWLIFTHAHALWGRQSPAPLHIAETFGRALTQHTFDDLTLLMFVGLGVYTWVRYGPFWGSMVLLPLALAASTGSVVSMKRQVLACFPVFYPLSEFLNKRWTFAPAVAIFVALQLLCLWRYINGIWVA